MKLYIFLLLSIGVYAFAELPDTVTDKAINTNLENLDMKTSKAQKDINAVYSGGLVNLNLEYVSATGTTSAAVSCSNNKNLLSCFGGRTGNCTNFNVVAYSKDTCTATCDTGATVNIHAICGSVKGF